MSPDEAANKATREEWRKLGFFYERDDVQRLWRFIGSQEGLLGFASLLDQYVTDPRNTPKSEHEHYGPYMYLKVMTWTEPGISADSIHGSLDELAQLAALLRSRLQGQDPGVQLIIGPEYSPRAHYSLQFNVMSDGFNPASADPQLMK